SSTRRNGQSAPLSSRRVLSQRNPARPAIVVIPATMKLRRLRRLNSGPPGSITGRLLLHDFQTSDHRAEIVPSGFDHLYDMDHEESGITHGQPEMFEAYHLITAKNTDEPGKLCRLVNREAGDQRASAHQDDCRVSDLLCSVEFSARRMIFAQVQIVKSDLNRFNE